MSQKGYPDGTETGAGSLASEETKQEWGRAYDFYLTTRGSRGDRLLKTAEHFGISHKAAKRRIKNFEAWQLRETGQLPPDPYRKEMLALGNQLLEKKRAASRSGRMGREGQSFSNATQNRDNQRWTPRDRYSREK
ncbi:MAG TPA: hypothetical protein VGB17_02340 [Pyrinomonadaceae bacterium]|jgi:hypothetical protein